MATEPQETNEEKQKNRKSMLAKLKEDVANPNTPDDTRQLYSKLIEFNEQQIALEQLPDDWKKPYRKELSMCNATIANADLPSSFRKRYVERKKDIEHFLTMDKANDIDKALVRGILSWVLLLVVLTLIVTILVLISRR